jgi:hypothetical protein
LSITKLTDISNTSLSGTNISTTIQCIWVYQSKLSRKMTDFWDIAPCSLVEVDQCFRGVYCIIRLRHQSTSRLHGTISQKAIIFIRTAVTNCLKPHKTHQVGHTDYVFILHSGAVLTTILYLHKAGKLISQIPNSTSYQITLLINMYQWNETIILQETFLHSWLFLH